METSFGLNDTGMERSRLLYHYSPGRQRYKIIYKLRGKLNY
jgi:hypothetical protein